MRAADVEALHELLRAEVASAEMFRERLRAIIAPEMPAYVTEGSISRLD
jgi:hypothetical protein